MALSARSPPRARRWLTVRRRHHLKPSEYEESLAIKGHSPVTWFVSSITKESRVSCDSHATLTRVSARRSPTHATSHCWLEKWLSRVPGTLPTSASLGNGGIGSVSTSVGEGASVRRVPRYGLRLGNCPLTPPTFNNPLSGPPPLRALWLSSRLRCARRPHEGTGTGGCVPLVSSFLPLRRAGTANDHAPVDICSGAQRGRH